MLGSDDVSSFSKLSWDAVRFVEYGNINEALVLFHNAYHLAIENNAEAAHRSKNNL